jgi:ferredoxin, 2Fe-2S
MSRLFVTTRDGEIHQLSGQDGTSIMQTIRNAGISELLAICAGSCSCATCHVYVDSADADKLPPMGSIESDVLDTISLKQAGSRLSCQLIFCDQLDGLRVTIAPKE